MFVKDTAISTLLWWSKRGRVSLDERISSKFHKMNPLVLVARRLQIDDCAIEQRYQRIHESLNNTVQIGVIYGMEVVDVAFHPTKC